MKSMSVYQQVGDLLTSDPSAAYNIDLEQLETVLSIDGLLPPDIYTKVLGIVTQRRNAPTRKKITVKPVRPKLNVKAVKPVKPIAAKQVKVVKPIKPIKHIKVVKPVKPAQSSRKGSPLQMVETLNGNHSLSASMTTEQLKTILEWSDQYYYDPPENQEAELLDDRVYDYIKRLYNERLHKTKNVKVTMKSLSKTGVGYDTKKPRRERDVRLPFYLGSLDNLFKGEGHVDKWKQKIQGPYHLSAKMDGTSGLYHDGGLFTRGNAVQGRDISHIVPHMNLPDVNYTVRGEIVMKKSIFDSKYKGKKSKYGGVRKVNRCSVSGSLIGINHIDYGFIADLDFIAYEIMLDSDKQMTPSEQFEILERDGFMVAHNSVVDDINDDSLAAVYGWILTDYDYLADGVVVRGDRPYKLMAGKNPNYAKAFKDPLPQDTAVTTIIDIEWNPSQHGYLVPTITYEPVFIHGVELKRTAGHNARDVIKRGLGPGAKVEIIYWGMVNPRINKVLEPVEPYLPDISKVPYVWKVNDAGEEVHIKLVDTQFKEEEEEDEDNPIHTVRVKKIYSSMVKIGAKGIGETTVDKIYRDQPHMRTVGAFFNIKMKDVKVLGGGTASSNVVSSIKNALAKLDMPQLMAASKVFGRGLGEKKFRKAFEDHPELFEREYSENEYLQMFLSSEGFAKKTAELAAKGMMVFLSEFVQKHISDDLMVSILDNTNKDDQKIPSASHHVDIKGQNICLTGFRDAEVSDFITRNGGKVQSGCSGSTNMVVRKSDDYANKKTETAETKGIKLISKEEFILNYMS